MRKVKNLTGLRIHRIRVLGLSARRSRFGSAYWKYECACGRVREARSDVLHTGRQRSCGCERRQNKFTDITGRRFGRLVAQWPAGRGGIGNHQRAVVWLCLCDCGNLKVILGKSLRLGLTKSCGCWAIEKCRTHGRTKTAEYRILTSARARAKHLGIPFNLTLADIVIPSHCPVLGLPLAPNTGNRHPSANSPTLDRLIPSVGYVTGNVAVISHRANAIKNDATSEEIKRVVAWMER